MIDQNHAKLVENPYWEAPFLICFDCLYYLSKVGYFWQCCQMHKRWEKSAFVLFNCLYKKIQEVQWKKSQSVVKSSYKMEKIIIAVISTIVYYIQEISTVFCLQRNRTDFRVNSGILQNAIRYNLERELLCLVLVIVVENFCIVLVRKKQSLLYEIYVQL